MTREGWACEINECERWKIGDGNGEMDGRIREMDGLKMRKGGAGDTQDLFPSFLPFWLFYFFGHTFGPTFSYTWRFGIP